MKMKSSSREEAKEEIEAFDSVSKYYVYQKSSILLE